MVIGERLRTLREMKRLSQGHVEKKTGLLRCYISRVENGHTVPSVQTLEKLARALGIPMYQIFYEGEKPPKLLKLETYTDSNDIAWGHSGDDARFLTLFVRALSKTSERDRRMLLAIAQKMARSAASSPAVRHRVA